MISYFYDIHHNPVRHGYTARRQDWPFTSAHQYLADVGREEAKRIWRRFPILDMGNGWDNEGPDELAGGENR